MNSRRCPELVGLRAERLVRNALGAWLNDGCDGPRRIAEVAIVALV